MSKETRQSPGCLAVLFNLFGGGGKESKKPSVEHGKDRKAYPYRMRDAFLSPAELSFYHVLRQVTSDRVVILSKVGLWDIFFVARPNENQRAKAHVDRKHVDFLLCHPHTMQPMVGVELDDSSHQQADRILRDADVDLVFEAAQLPLLHIPAGRGYSVSELSARLSPYLGNGGTLQTPERSAAPAAVAVESGQVPLCPKCGSVMVLREAKQGAHKGEKFYACPNYPQCKSVSPIQA